MSILNFIIRKAAPLPDIESCSRFLFVGPHPDDIEIGAGATAAKLAADGKDVCFLICIDGRYGIDHTSLSGDSLAKERRREAEESAALLGVKDVRFLNLVDAGNYEFADMKAGIKAVIDEYRPEVIFCPDPDVISECHIDHLNTGRACKELSFFAGCEAIAFYMTAKMNRFVNTTGYLEKQLEAIFGCHLTQFPPDCGEAKSIPLYLKLRAYDFGIRSFCRTAEGFRVLGKTHMHCLPEAGEF